MFANYVDLHHRILSDALRPRANAGGFEKAALLGLQSTLIRHENGAFRKRSSNWRNLKMPAFRFRLDQKHFENGGFRQRCSYDNYVDFPARVFHKHKSEKNDR